ncbi:MAG: NAD(P)/FAD-dependent oxidoreductase [Thermodesulfobacteriota bacterium]|nr:NAD(P)/FAD-dependent oxidoreductase [Thermodesulfobacteriota bacterium]
MDKFSITIIGAGVIGLAVAEELSRHYGNVLLLEKEHTFGQETSSRQSGVIHAGIYYPPGFLKARFCKEGNGLLYDLCEKRDIPHRKTGKLVVAVTEEEEEKLLRLRERAEENGITDLSLLSGNEVEKREPEIRARAALFSPSTGIVDSHSLLRSFYVGAGSNGAVIVFRSKVTAARFDRECYEIEINSGEYQFQTGILINCAGLYADRVCGILGIDVEKRGYRLRYCKGDYFSVSPAPKFRHLVYPVPQGENEGLGIHATLDLGGRVRFGPDTEYVNELEYAVREDKRETFYRSVRTYLPGIKEESLHPDMSGIRPKLQGPGEPYRDFIIREESGIGYPGLINLIGIESPGLTSCIPVARHVHALVQEITEIRSIPVRLF